jgi:hypothetical protein
MKTALGILAAAVLFSQAAAASIGEDFMCWDPDVEHATSCDDE